MLTYQTQSAKMSLADGLAEYYRKHPFLTRGEHLRAEAQAFFRCHDVVHVLYGCDTSLTDEAVVKLSSIFGTSAGFGVLKGYSLYEAIDIYRELELGEVLGTMLAALMLIGIGVLIWRAIHKLGRRPGPGQTRTPNVPNPWHGLSFRYEYPTA